MKNNLKYIAVVNSTSEAIEVCKTEPIGMWVNTQNGNTYNESELTFRKKPEYKLSGRHVERNSPK